MKKTFLMLVIIIIGFLLVSGTKLMWSTRDEWKGPVVQTCGYYGIWNQQLKIRLIVYQSCMPI